MCSVVQDLERQVDQRGSAGSSACTLLAEREWLRDEQRCEHFIVRCAARHSVLPPLSRISPISALGFQTSVALQPRHVTRSRASKWCRSDNDLGAPTIAHVNEPRTTWLESYIPYC
jgi:hypothetical protein